MKLLKRDSSTGEYPVNISVFLITPFYRAPLVAASNVYRLQ